MTTIRELLISIDTQLNEAALREAEKKAAAALRRAEKEAEKALKQIKQTQAQAMQQLAGAGERAGTILRNVFIGLSVAVPLATAALLNLNSQVTLTIAKIGILSGNVKTARADFAELLNISSQTGLAFEAVSDVYGRLNMNAKELNVTQREMMEVTKGVAQSIILSGGTMASQQGALMQLGQAFGNPIVQAQEFNSLLDGAPLLVKEMAQSILGPNGTAGALRRLVLDQGLTNKMMFVAIQDALPRLNNQFKQMPLTLDMFINKLKLIPLRLGLAFGNLKAPQQFLEMLNELVERTTAYLIRNQDIIKTGLKDFFDGVTLAVKATVAAYKLFQPFLEWSIQNLPTIAKLVGALAASLATLAATTKLVTIATTVWQTVTSGAFALMLTNPVTGFVAVLSALAGATVLVATNWDKVTAALKGAWEWMVKVGRAAAAISFDAIKKFFALPTLADARQLQAQRQAANGSSVRNVTNSANTTVNINGPAPSPQVAKRMGKGFTTGSLRGFQALEAF